MLSYSCQRDHDWLERTLADLRYRGCAVVTEVLDLDFLSETRAAMYEVQAAIRGDVGEERLARAGELGVLRLMLAYDDRFFRFLELPEVLAVVDATVSDTAILHLQNGLILPSFDDGKVPETFQTSFHRDFPRHLGGSLASVNAFFAIDEFTEQNGATLVIPGTHQQAEPPDPRYLAAAAVPAVCPAGSMLVFDSTLWHAAGANVSGRDRLAINHQYTRSFFNVTWLFLPTSQSDFVREREGRTAIAATWALRAAVETF